jgi:hypothetical protein
MASTYSTNLALELIGTGDQSGTWGTTTNTNLGTLLEQAIVGYTTQALSGAGPTAITIPNGATGVGRNYVLEFTGSPTAGHIVTVPAVQKSYVLYNNTTVSIVVKVSGQTGVTIAVGKKALVYNNATDIIEIANAPVTEAGTQTLTNKTLTTPSIATVVGGTTASSTLTLQSTSGVGTSDAIAFKVGNNGATTALTIGTGTAASLTFGGTAQRFIADFDNATLSNRFSFITATTNASTGIYALPNGTSTAASWQATNAADPTNASKILIATNASTDVQLVSGRNGSGTYLPLSFYTNGSQQMQLDTSGRLNIGTSGVAAKLYVSGNAASAIVALTDAATIAVDMSTSNNFSVTLAGNRTLGNPTNLTPGQSGIIYVTQDATGSRTLAYSSYWKFPGGTAPTLTTAANSVDALVYTVRTSTSITVQSLLNIA